MALCKKLPDIGGSNSTCKNASVCQKSEDSGTYTNLGTYDGRTQFVKLEANGFWALFPNGETHKDKNNKTCQLKSYYVFVCDKDSPWIPVIGQPGQPAAASSIPGTPIVTFDNTSCTYNVTVRYSGACFTVTPAAQIAVLSAGSVILILVTVAFATYCIAGVTYNYCTGAEQRNLVPHSEFWEELPVNIREGFRFTFSCCQSTSTKTYEQL